MKKGDVCIVNLIAGVGHEQYGQRPAILVADIKTGIAIVIPLTTNLKMGKWGQLYFIDLNPKFEARNPKQIRNSNVLVSELLKFRYNKMK